MKLLVIGGGIAGTAAAWAAARGGASVELCHDQAGASALYSGALDDPSGDARPASRLDPDVVAFAAALGCWQLPARAARIATASGCVREVRGRDAALLDLEPLAGRRIAVADIDRDDWDGPLLAGALAASAWAVRTKTIFLPVRIQAVERGFERRIAVYDFAALHDDQERLSKLAQAAETAVKGYDALLVGPWLGLQPDTVDRLRRTLRVSLGETTSPPGAAAGARFERARDQVLEQAGIAVRKCRVTRLAVQGASVEGQCAGMTLQADAAVLCIGGVVAGGVALAEAGAHEGGRAFTLSLEVPATLELDGRELDEPSTLFGIDLESRGLEILDRVGIATDGARVRGQQRLFCAGDAIAGRPRTALEAARSGIAAARAAMSRH
jgi:anaerobic glycerol-3-phosphate dehydrogenase